MTGRRQFLLGAFAAAAPRAWSQQRLTIRVAGNQGVENAALHQLLLDAGIANSLSLDIQLVESRTVSGPMESLLSDSADICMVSGFVGVLPAIAQGQPLRLVSAAMLRPALAVYTAADNVRKLRDLPGSTFGVGPLNGLLHNLMLALLRKKRIDASTIRFVNSGSNAQVLEAVIAGKVDAGLSGIAGADSARTLSDGFLWQQLPEYTYQPSYASLRALQEKPEALARCLAAYTRLFRLLSAPASKSAYLAARRKVAPEGHAAEGEAVWNFIQRCQPYALKPGLNARRVAYLQNLNVALGTQARALPFRDVVDTSPAHAAERWLSGR